MKLEVLIGGLNSPDPAVRLDVVRVLGMLDETRALEALRKRHAVETDPVVQSAIGWAGKRLFEAQQAGYSTVDEICRHFGVDREIEHMPDAAEAEVMKKLQDEMEMDMLRLQQRANERRMGMTLAAGLGGAIVGGATMGLAAAGGAMLAGMASSGGDPRPQIGTQRNPATAPSNSDISIWVKRLHEGSSPAIREQATIELAQLNNPAALPHLAAAFVGDEAPGVRQAAQRYGKVLYWSAVYWEMEHDGSLQKEIEKRAAAIGKNLSKPDPAAESTPGTPGGSGAPAAGPAQTPAEGDVGAQEDIAEILRKAQAARARRQKKP